MTTQEIRFFTDRNGFKIAYSISGTGPLLICPAWWLSNLEEDWQADDYREFFATIAEGFTLIRYDRPGVGLSGSKYLQQSLENEIALLKDLLAELNAKQCSLLGMSSGGPAALGLAAQNPELVQRVVFIGSYANGPGICSKEVQDAMIGMVRAHWGLGSDTLAQVFIPDADKDTVSSFTRQQRNMASADTAARFLELTYHLDASKYLDQCQTPALIIHRKGDRAISSDLGRDIARKLPNSSMVMFEGRNHVPWIDGLDIARVAHNFLTDGGVRNNQQQQPKSDGVRFDEHSRTLVIENTEIALTPLEYKVLKELVLAKGQVVTRDHLLEKAWNQSFAGSNRVDTLIRGLRKKLNQYFPSIQTAIGHGYRFDGWIKSPEESK